MSTLEATTQWLERASDWANPILIKETRQSLKSRQFIATFMLLLISAWLITLFGVVLAGNQIEYGAAGRGFFFFYYFVLCAATMVIVPFGAYRSLLNEQDLNTYELLSITSLSPRKIVWGKLFSALIQVFIFYSAIAPFIAFTALLEGFNVVLVAFLLVVALLVSLAESMTALMVSTLSRQRQWQAVNSVFVLGGLVWWFSAFYFGIVLNELTAVVAFDDPDFWWMMGTVTLAAATYFVLFQQITTAQLTFESGNRSTAIRVTCVVQFWLLLGGFSFYVFYNGLSFDEDVVMFMSTLAGLHWAAVGLMISTEDDYLSRRVRRSLPRNPLLGLLLAPLMPGGSRGLLLTVLNLCVLVGFVAAIGFFGLLGNPRDLPMLLKFTLAMAGYVVFYIGIGAALLRWGRMLSADIRPAHARVLTLLLFFAGLIAPLLPGALGLVPLNEFSLVYVSNPFVALMEIEDTGGGQTGLVTIVLSAAMLALLVNFRAMLRGIAEIVSPRPGT